MSDVQALWALIGVVAVTLFGSGVICYAIHRGYAVRLFKNGGEALPPSVSRKR